MTTIRSTLQRPRTAAFIAIFVLVGFLPRLVASQQIATYELRFESEWSASTHPSNFPSSAHFSGLIGTTHNATVSFWGQAQLASAGIKSMAETGSKSSLNTFFNASDAEGISDIRIDGPGLSTSPSSVTISFQVNSSHPLLTLVSMIAPSPDWFVGVSSYPLMAFGTWRQHIEIDLFAWDAGTDSGTSYTSGNVATQPPAGVSMLTDGPFLVGGNTPRMGRFILDLLSVTGTAPVEVPQGTGILVDVFPNPFSDRVSISYSMLLNQHVELAVYDLTGRLIETFVSDAREAGNHQFTWTPRGIAKGSLVLRLSSGSDVTYKLLHHIN